MATDFDTCRTAGYPRIDPLVQTQVLGPPHPGPRPRMADSEVLTLLVVGQGPGASERALLRWAAAELPAAFPSLLRQSAFNRRARRLGPICVQLLILLAAELDPEPAPYAVVDTIGVPLARQCRGQRHRLFGDEAGIGVGGSDHRFFSGCALLLGVTPAGVITGFVVGSAAPQDRWLRDPFLRWRHDPAHPLWTVADLAHHAPGKRARSLRRTGPTGPRWWPDSVGHADVRSYLTDNGFQGAVWQAPWAEDAGAGVIASRDAATAARAHHRRRQIVETVNASLVDVFHLPFPQATTMWGVVCRIARTWLAHNLGIWCNRWLGRPDLALQTLVAR